MESYDYECPAGHRIHERVSDFGAQAPVSLICDHEDEHGKPCGLTMVIVESPINDLL